MNKSLAIFTLICFFAVDARAENATRILFIGNSYTSQIRKTVSSLMKASPEGEFIEMEFISPGGKTLEFHLQTQSTIQKIKDGKWDFVVLQDQSQTPAVFPEKFEDAAKGLDAMIDAAGAKTVFYQTWGRRDGDSMNPKLFPTYESMQKKLSDSYHSAAKRCDALLAPVGDTWAKVRKADPKLGQALYKGDGSHPSDKGAYLAAAVLYATIFDKSPEAIEYKGGIPDVEATLILEALRQTVVPSGKRELKPRVYPVDRTLKDSNGREIEVRILGRSKTRVYFSSAGKNHEYEIGDLSKEDQSFLESLPVNR